MDVSNRKFDTWALFKKGGFSSVLHVAMENFIELSPELIGVCKFKGLDPFDHKKVFTSKLTSDFNQTWSVGGWDGAVGLLDYDMTSAAHSDTSFSI